MLFDAIVTSRKGRVSRNDFAANHIDLVAVTSRKGRVSRNNNPRP